MVTGLKKKNMQGSKSEVQVGETQTHVASHGEGLLQHHLHGIQRQGATGMVRKSVLSHFFHASRHRHLKAQVNHN